MLILSFALPIILIILMVAGMVVVIERHEKQALEAEPRNVILPSSIQNPDDFAWFETVMKMAGMEDVKVLSTCDCGFAEECYMHCNHNLSTGGCTGHAYQVRGAKKQTPDLIPWTGTFQPVKRSYEEIVETEHRQRTLSDKDRNAFGQKMIDKRNAKLKAEFEASKKAVRNPKKDIEAMRQRMDERHIKVRELERVIHYSVKNDAYMLQNGRVITRQTLEDLVNCGNMEAVYEFGRREPVAYMESPPDVSWIKMERV